MSLRLVTFALSPPSHNTCARVVQSLGSLQWRHNGLNGISNHQPHHCLLNRLFRRKSNKTSKLCVTGLCAGNSLVTGEFPAQMASDAENFSISWCHHVIGHRYWVMINISHWWIGWYIWTVWYIWTICHLLMPYGAIDLDQHWFRQWLEASSVPSYYRLTYGQLDH